MTATATPTELERHDDETFVPSADSLGRYLEAIGRHPLLSREQERCLARRASAGDAAAARRLVECNLRLVVAAARRYRGLGPDDLDLIQEGNVGLIGAVERYDWRRDVPFAAYASWWIRRGICDAINSRSRLVRVPVRVCESACCPTTPTRTPRWRSASPSTARPCGTRSRRSASVRRILERRYGLDGNEPGTLTQVAAELGISRERARELESRALRELAAHPQLRALRAAA
jgi:DNA-directed RNA polymerase sigma subunit (sigma70/sigma32)